MVWLIFKIKFSSSQLIYVPLLGKSLILIDAREDKPEKQL